MWDHAAFECDTFTEEDAPKFGFPWDNFVNLKDFTSNKSLDLRNIALRTTPDFSFDLFGIEISANFTLKGESEFWVFSRSSVNLSINAFETEKDFDVLNKYSTIIKISKEDKSQKCFISLCILTEDENGDYYFQTFFKRQLINFSSKLN
jgi:hypothetical protein